MALFHSTETHNESHERRWQERMETTTPPSPRSPVTPTLYAAHCSEMTGDALTHGLYTAYPVVDYKNKDDVGSPRQFQWHGDPGAMLWKARSLMSEELELTMEPRPAHLEQLWNTSNLLTELKNLRAKGDLKWVTRMESLASHAPPPGPSSDGGDGAGADSSRPTPPPPPPPPPAPPYGDSDTPHQFPSHPPFPTTHNPKRKHASSDSAVVVSERPPWKTTKTRDNDMTTLLRQAQSIRWGGPERSTEETVRYWNAIFGSREGADSKPS